MLPYNILNPKDGRPVATPTQDMVLGIYYLTVTKDGDKGEGKCFASYEEARMAYENDIVSLHAKIKVRIEDEIIETTVGRLIFNYEVPIPKELGYINEEVGKKKLAQIVAQCYRTLKVERTAELLDGFKRVGFAWATKAGITIGLRDLRVPIKKQEIIGETEQKVEEIEKQFRRGLITEDERYQRVISLWSRATEKVTLNLMENLDKFNPVYMMATSGARGNVQQLRQLAGMRGLMADPSGRIIDLPIKANFREGLTVLEYFTSTHGARKGLADTALRTADSGYLTRRLVDVAQDVIVREEDCGTTEGLEVKVVESGGEVIESLEERLVGRFALEDRYQVKF